MAEGTTPTGTILVFARAPVPGQVKTRLIPALGPAGAAELHGALVRHALCEAAAAGFARVELWGTGTGGAGALERWAEAAGARLCRQRGADLGERMGHALAAATARGEPALVAGSDCPWLDAAGLARARAALETHDAVLGPAEDGGYVLLGLHRAPSELFTDVPWGTGRVLACTRERLAALGWRWHELEARPDVDRPDDLEGLRALGPPWTGLMEGVGPAG